GRGDAPLAVQLGVREGSAETAQGGLRLRQPADLPERGLGVDLDVDPALQVPELFPELSEDVLDPAADGPLLTLRIALWRSRRKRLWRIRSAPGAGIGHGLVPAASRLAQALRSTTAADPARREREPASASPPCRRRGPPPAGEPWPEGRGRWRQTGARR